MGDAIDGASGAHAADRRGVCGAGSGLFRSVPVRAVATVKGLVYADWNGNGLQDAGEDPVAGVPLRIEAVGAAESSKNGEFLFTNVPDGLHEVGLDLGALPIDFDAPAIPRLQVALSGRDTRQVAFGLIPLGSIRGRVVRDLNGNGTADSTEPAIDGAVVVLDGGKRSERSKRGQYAFEAVQSGEHSVTLLADSLPDGALIAGEATQIATLGRERTAVGRAVSSCHSRSALKSGRCFRDPRPAHCRNPSTGAPRWKNRAGGEPKADAAVAKSDAPPAKAAAPAPTPGTLRASGRRVRRPHPRSTDGGRSAGQGAVGASLEPPLERRTRPTACASACTPAASTRERAAGTVAPVGGRQGVGDCSRRGRAQSQSSVGSLQSERRPGSGRRRAPCPT